MVCSTFWLAGFAFVATEGVTSCRDTVGSGNPPDSAVRQVIVLPPSITLAVGARTTLSASVVAGPALTDHTVNWSSSDTTVATVDSIGNVVAVAAGRASIIAAAHSHPQVTGTSAVTVTPAQ